ncbi:MAG: hypothetical protein EXQ90_08315 [Rhodospirillales bacterium]|nr:hypothetical protein [Rhodospirillales bacterium]
MAQDAITGSLLSPRLGERALRRLVYASPAYALTLGRRVPPEVLGTPPDPWPGYPARAEAILQGEFILAGRRLPFGPGQWPSATPNPLVAAAIHGFDWLRDLRAHGSDVARECGRALVQDWLASHDRWEAITWRADVLADRIANWLSHYAFLSGADAEFGAALRRAAARQLKHLARAAANAPQGASQFVVIKGLVYGGVALPGLESILARGLAMLEREVVSQILPDGGHYQRHPGFQLEVMRTLIDIEGALLAAHIEAPPELRHAIDRMAPMVRCLRHGDGRFPLFNGSTEGDEVQIALVLSRSGTRGRALSAAPHSGYHRLTAGRTVLLMDAGPPPPAEADEHAHAGTLSFEMSIGRDRLIVNCGTQPVATGEWRDALRHTAAHSTLVVDDSNSAEVSAAGGLGHRPGLVEVIRREVDGCFLIEASHDGYRNALGLVHRRSLYLASDGSDVRGEDILEGTGGQSAAVRFHLHPRVQASMIEGGSAVLLKLPSGLGFRFRAAGGTVSLEDSIYAGDPAGVKRSVQIVVTAPLAGMGAQIKWRLARESRAGT